VITPYVPEFVADLKEEIPYHAKSWDRDSRNWLVDGDYEEALLMVASNYFETTVVVTEAETLRRERAAKASSQPSAAPPHDTNECARKVRSVWREEAALYLLPGAPYAVIQAAHRALAKLLHPDVTHRDTNAEMAAVNRAYDTLTKRHKGASA
jgi:hypothetical protein